MAIITAACGNQLVTTESELEMQELIDSGVMREHREYSEAEVLEFQKLHQGENITSFESFVHRHIKGNIQ